MGCCPGAMQLSWALGKTLAVNEQMLESDLRGNSHTQTPSAWLPEARSCGMGCCPGAVQLS